MHARTTTQDFRTARPSLWQTLLHDWRTWNRFDRIAAPFIALTLLAVSLHGLFAG